MAAGIRLTHQEAVERFSVRGYELRSEYQAQSKKVSAHCIAHGETHEVLPSNVFKGQGLWCCANAGRSEKHTGKKLSDATKRKLSELNSGSRNPHHGAPRPASVRAKVSSGLRAAAARSVDYAALKARTGKTSGKQGYFYVVRLGSGLLKFGSIVKLKIGRRLELLQKDHGSAAIVLLAKVDDAGRFEADAMERCREHWSHGEYFHDWLKEANP